MRLGEKLARLASVRPHAFNSFYRRVRVVRESPQPIPASATVNVTHRCSLRCPFCIAADVRQHRDMPLAVFRSICDELVGIGRLTLVGGEPFQHPGLAALLELARPAAAEVEVFTNGLFLGSNPDLAADRLLVLVPDASSDWLTLVLSVDPAHASQMGRQRLIQAVDGVLAAEFRGLCKVRFSITHQALESGVYIDSATVEAAIEEVAPRLARLFAERLVTGQVQNSFYFNSVICAQPPRTSSNTEDSTTALGNIEFLRVEDLLQSPEVAITFDQDNNVVVYTSLAAMWSNEPPAACRLGDLHEAGDRLLECSMPIPQGMHALISTPANDTTLAARALDDIDPIWLSAWQHAAAVDDKAAMDRIIRAAGTVIGVKIWDGGLAWADQQAKEIALFVRAGTGRATLRFGGEEPGETPDHLVVPRLFQILLSDESDAGAFAKQMASDLARLFVSSGRLALCPVFVGFRELSGRRVPLAEGESFPLSRVHLPSEVGFTQNDELVVRPVLQFSQGNPVRLLLPGIAAARGGTVASRRMALARLMAMVRALTGERITRMLFNELSPFLHSINTPDKTAGHLDSLDPTNLLTAFSVCSYDRNRQSPDINNPELLGILHRMDCNRFSDTSVEQFKSRSWTWLETASRECGLSSTAKWLLSRDNISLELSPQ